MGTPLVHGFVTGLPIGMRCDRRGIANPWPAYPPGEHGSVAWSACLQGAIRIRRREIGNTAEHGSVTDVPIHAGAKEQTGVDRQSRSTWECD